MHDWLFKQVLIKTYSALHQTSLLKAFLLKKPEVFCKNKVFLEISKNLQENICARVSFLIKLQAFIKKGLWRSCFPMNVAKFLRTLFLQNSSGRQLQSNSIINILQVLKYTIRYTIWRFTCTIYMQSIHYTTTIFVVL